jgi:hypothetical protein
LERLIGANDLVGIAYLERGFRAPKSICRIHLRDAHSNTVGRGTGFLVAPGVLMTNHHVIADEGLRSSSNPEQGVGNKMSKKKNDAPARVALCIGINDYPGSGSDLHGCVNDALDWQAALQARGFSTEMLLDEQATGRAIRKHLESLASKARAGDTVIITYSGHGSFVPDLDGDEDDGYDECWCPHDIVANGPITDDDLHDIFTSRADDVRWIVLSDSCHSGTIVRFSPITTPSTTLAAASPQRLVRFLPPSVFNKDASRIRGTRATRFVSASAPGRKDSLLISGCQDSEYSYDAWFQGRPNGAFTFVALRALDELGPSVTYKQWHERIRTILPSQQYPQAPNIFGPSEMREWVALGGLLDSPAPDAGSVLGASPDEGPLRDSWDVGKHLAYKALAARPRSRALSRAPKIPLVAEGDSWFDYPWNDLLSCLEDDHGFDVTSVSHKGDTVESMAYSGGQLQEFVRAIDKMLRRNEIPKAILLSGGGNDVAGDEFAQLLNHAASVHPGLNMQIVSAVIDQRIRDSFAAIIAGVTAVCEDRIQKRIPILIHGYAYAVPDGRGFAGGWWILPGPWLKPGFNQKGYHDLAENQRSIDTLIDRLNDMQMRLVASPGFEHVHHVDLRSVLPRDTYTDWWANELHPTKRGFQLVAGAFARRIAPL